LNIPTQPQGRRRRWPFFWALVLLSGLAYGLWVAAANRPRPMPSLTAIHDGRLSAARWILEHHDAVLSDNNPMLWVMVARSAALTDDPALKGLVDEYLRRYILPNAADPFRQLFGLTYHGGLRDLESLATVPDYRVFLLFALTCDPRLSALERVRAQQNSSYCPESLSLSPTCATHQLMGLRIAEETGCMSVADTAATKGVLVKRIERQLFWDVRFVDTYLQRALMLTEERGAAGAGAAALQNILRSRMADGGWSSSQPLVPVGDGRSFAATQSGFGIVRDEGQFHATAQALLLFSLFESGAEP
jgi:hypothetical protein